MWFASGGRPSGGAGLCASMTSGCGCTRRRGPSTTRSTRASRASSTRPRTCMGRSRQGASRRSRRRRSRIRSGGHRAHDGRKRVGSGHGRGGRRRMRKSARAGRARRRRRHPRGSVVVRGSLVGGPGTDVGESVAEDGSGASLARASAHPTRERLGVSRVGGQRFGRRVDGSLGHVGDERTGRAWRRRCTRDPNERRMPEMCRWGTSKTDACDPRGPGASTLGLAPRVRS